MAKGSFSIEITGMDELFRVFEKASKESEKIASEALYEGAGIVADAVSKEINSIKTEPFKYAKDGKKRKPSPEEKEIIKKARHGVAKFKKNGIDVTTSVGFQNAGYAKLKGKTVPVAVIANTINSGTSFMPPQPFLRKAFKQNEGKAQTTIENIINKKTEELLKE